MKHLRELAIFVFGMLALAALVFGGFWLIIRGGGLLLRSWFRFFDFLPHSVALALAVMATALSVYAAWYLLAERRKRARVKA